MRILVTGGNGFVGRNVCKYLRALGCDITATYRTEKTIAKIDGVEYVKQDLSERITIEGKFDAIIHAAACSSASNEFSVEEYIRDNIDSARRIVDYARDMGIAYIFYFSSRSIYGDVFSKIVTEENDIVNQGKYGLTKYIAELVFGEATDIKTLGFRTPGIVGDGAHDIWLVDIVSKMVDSQDVVVSNFDTKNLVYIDDIAQFIYFILSEKYGEHFQYPVVNLACHESINNTEIVEIIKVRTGSASKITVVDPSDKLFVLDDTKAYSMGFVSRSPQDIVNGYLDTLLL